MKVILLQDIKGTGKKNQIVEVSDGFARNYLFPKKLALGANAAALNAVEKSQSAQAHREQQLKGEAEALAARLKGMVITVQARAGEAGRLYGSVTAQEVTDALAEQYGVKLEKRRVELPNPVRTVGDSEVNVWLYAGVTAKMVLRVVGTK